MRLSFIPLLLPVVLCAQSLKDFEQERRKGRLADPKKLESIQAQLKDMIASADNFVETNDYDRIVEANGGVGLNAGTGEDSTNFYYSFPSNRLELWFLLESERFLH